MLKRNWSHCWLAWQQSRALRLPGRAVFRKAFMHYVFSLKGKDKKNMFVLLICVINVVDIVSINNL